MNYDRNYRTRSKERSDEFIDNAFSSREERSNKFIESLSLLYSASLRVHRQRFTRRFAPHGHSFTTVIVVFPARRFAPRDGSPQQIVTHQAVLLHSNVQTLRSGERSDERSDELV